MCEAEPSLKGFLIVHENLALKRSVCVRGWVCVFVACTHRFACYHAYVKERGKPLLLLFTFLLVLKEEPLAISPIPSSIAAGPELPGTLLSLPPISTFLVVISDES